MDEKTGLWTWQTTDGRFTEVKYGESADMSVNGPGNCSLYYWTCVVVGTAAGNSSDAVKVITDTLSVSEMAAYGLEVAPDRTIKVHGAKLRKAVQALGKNPILEALITLDKANTATQMCRAYTVALDKKYGGAAGC